jgi:hypothetical protein
LAIEFAVFSQWLFIDLPLKNEELWMTDRGQLQRNWCAFGTHFPPHPHLILTSSSPHPYLVIVSSSLILILTSSLLHLIFTARSQDRRSSRGRIPLSMTGRLGAQSTTLFTRQNRLWNTGAKSAY